MLECSTSWQRKLIVNLFEYASSMHHAFNVCYL
jgi:hypothetical protein